MPHDDGSCNSGFSITYGDANFVLATDLGSVTDRAHHYMSLANYLVIESNYDSTMLDNGSYPNISKAASALETDIWTTPQRRLS